MATAPVEILVVGFPENKFTGTILPELERVVANGTITIVDGVFVTKDAAGTTTFVEFDELGAETDVSALRNVLDRVDGLVSDEDIRELTDGLAPGSSSAILVFEHTWAKALSEAVAGSGGQVLNNVRVPGDVVAEILATVPETD